ncbi:MMS19 nucleotide excision repair [Hypsizygus marmoreus]|uniref:MMS19 nucleotide excision repair protein n=1 Tax=Hypsizygus marmoreus TaxID=39966 RepID=A0A369JVH1_HYPMA|nr:MMS19 nucleotide excision repair [Hypsizygus marmoreus]
MESAERLVRTWMASGRDEEIEETVSEVSNDRIALIDIVKALGEYLTSEDDEIRAKGVDFLSSVLARSPVANFNRSSVHVLTNFYCSKLDDTETIIPALKGLNTLTRLPTCSSIDATTIIQALFRHVKMKALVHSVRFTVFSIIDTLMAQNRDALKALGKTFIAGYLSLAEGEKDPRNLLLAFAIARVILIEFDISDHIESLFNITFCYFPITFRPPPNDPYGITTDDLRQGLRACLNASPSFGPLAVPVFLEKLTAGSPSTKRDTLQTMAVCLPVYGSTLARVSGRKLWNALKLEIFQPTDPLTEEEALKTTRVLVETIYSHEEDALESNDDIQGLARDACEECIHILREPEKSSAKPAIKVLCAFMATTPSVSRYTLSQAVPHLVKLFLDPDEVSNRPPILLLLADLINAARDSTSQSTEEVSPLMIPYKDDVLGVVSVGLKTTLSRLPALSVIRGLITTKSLLSEEELGFIVHLVTETFQSEDSDNDDFSDSAILSVLTTISASVSRHVQEQTLPILFSSLPDTAPTREAAAERAKCWRNLLALRTLCVHPELFEILVIRLTTKVDLICVPKAKDDIEDDPEPNTAYAHSLLKTIADTLSAKVDAGHPDVTKYIDRLVPRLYNLFIYSSLQPTKYVIATDHRLISVAGDIIMLVTQCLPVQRQEKCITAIFEVFSSGDVHGIANGLQTIPPGFKLLLFNEATPTAQKNLLPLFTAGVVTAHKEVRLPIPTLDTFLDQALTWSLVHADNDLQRESAWHLISSIINKHAEDISSFLDNQLNHYWYLRVANTEIASEKRQQAIQAWIWISKGLLVRNHPMAVNYTDRLFEVFNDDSISWDAGKAIGQLASVDVILTKKHHAIMRILHAQKFVNRVLPHIIAGAQDSSRPPHEQTAYLVALTSLIEASPKTAYAHEMPALMPLLLRGLELPDVDIRADVIKTLLAAAEGDASEQSLVSEHASTLVTYMLKNSMVEEMSSMQVRIPALRYLGVLPKIVRYDVLHPCKSIVLRELAKVLDDPKRLVRKEAVDTRTIWFKYNG